MKQLKKISAIQSQEVNKTQIGGQFYEKKHDKWLLSQDDEDRQIYAKLNTQLKKKVIKNKTEMWARKCKKLDKYMGGTKEAKV